MGSLKDAFGDIAKRSIEQPGWCVFRSKEYDPIAFKDLRYYTVNQHDNLCVEYIDGGQQVIFESSSFLIGLIRVAASAWKGSVRASVVRKEFLTLIQANEKHYELFFFKTDGTSHVPFDDEFFTGTSFFEITSYNLTEVFAMVRRHAELGFAKQRCFQSSIICLDGSLRTFTRSESELMHRLQETCEKQHTELIALQKTSSIMTNSGESLQKLSNNSFNGPWISSKLCINYNKRHLASIHATRLHGKSRHIFVMDIVDETKVQTILENLTANSKDPLFLGYPYGLVDADRIARVEDVENEHYRLEIRKLLAEHGNYLSTETASKDAHEILDSMQF